MSTPPKREWQWRPGLIAGLVTAIATLLIPRPIGDPLARLSYDAAFLFAPEEEVGEIVIVEMDEKSHAALGQTYGAWDRGLHARLVDRLTSDEARLVVFDVFFADPGEEQATKDLARAIRENGQVVVGVSATRHRRAMVTIIEPSLPLSEIEQVAAGRGSIMPTKDEDGVVRRLNLGSEVMPSLACSAAKLVDVTPPEPSTDRGGQRWMRFYREAGSGISYCDALETPKGFFKDKVVFVGAHPQTRNIGDEVDEFRTPLTRWGGVALSGVRIHATAFSNLFRGDEIRLLSGNGVVLILLAFLWGSVARYLQPVGLALGAIGLALVISVAATLSFWTLSVWLPWAVLPAVSIPFGVVWTLALRLRSAPASTTSEAAVPGERRGRATQTASEQPTLTPSLVGDRRPQALEPTVPDHVLIKRIGRGAYGEVWLARNAVGLFHAVKLVYRSAFQHGGPYEREFRGIQRFMPVSRNHPNLIHVLHVGRNDQAEYFYYVMEAGDDESGRFPADAAQYSPANLGKVLRARGRLPVTECLAWMIPLADALAFLHKQELVHRDIKPSNIIFVSGMPKLADIGLVTAAATRGREVTYLGTEGYIPPEGPGTPSADVFSLGKVLYEMSMGLDRLQFPNLPTKVFEEADDPALLELNEIILKACEANLERRFSCVEDFLNRCQRLKEAVGSS